MTPAEYNNIQNQIRGIENLMPYYSGKTIDNVLSQLKARVREENKRRDVEIEMARFG